VRRFLWTLVGINTLFLLLQGTGMAGGDADALQGVWVAQSLEADGKPAPADAIKLMRFTFKGDRLLLRGNARDNREEECAYKIDPKQSPKQLDFTMPNEKMPILGIYAVMGDELKLCIRHASNSSEGRPTSFSTTAGKGLVLVVLKKERP
jgi:uncharacterized protein (TIGR03067 family)